MKKLALFVALMVSLIGLSLAWNALGASAIVPLAAQPINTPVAPGGTGAIVNQEVPLPLTAQVPRQAQSPVPLIQQQIPSDGLSQQAPPYTRISRSDGRRFQTTGTRMVVAGHSSPQSPSAETCMDVLANPQMDVLELGDGTGTVDSWTILAQQIYYSEVYSHSASYSLKEMDELDGSDTFSITIGSTRWDYDEFGQAFLASGGLTYLKISFSSLYFEPDANDDVYARLWTLDSQGNLDELIALAPVPDDDPYPQYTWGNYYFELTSSQLVTASGKSLMFVFTMFSNQQSPSQRVYFDDAQVRLCYNVGANKVYLPVVIKQPQDTTPTCNPYEPDNRDHRGSITVGATCYGSFGPSDDKDYYEVLNPKGETLVRLWLRNLPPGSNWNATLWEDASGSYVNPCNIGTVGDADKYKDCTLDPSKRYLVVVGAGAAPSSSKTYEMSVLSQSTPTTPGIYGQVKYNGAPAAGIYLILRYYNGSAWSTWGSPVATDSSGNYRFTSVPSLGSGQQYYVKYSNDANGNADNTNYLAFWNSFSITSYSTGADVAGGSFDIANISLSSPSAGATVSLPRAFSWIRRTATTSDSYEWDIFDWADGDPYAYTAPLGYVSGITLNSLPSGFSYGVQYAWDVWAIGPDGGTGASYWSRYVTFSSSAAESPGVMSRDQPTNQLNLDKLIELRKGQASVGVGIQRLAPQAIHTEGK